VGLVVVVACRVIGRFLWLKVMLGIEKSVLLGPRVHNPSIPNITSALSMGNKKK